MAPAQPCCSPRKAARVERVGHALGGRPWACSSRKRGRSGTVWDRNSPFLFRPIPALGPLAFLVTVILSPPRWAIDPG